MDEYSLNDFNWRKDSGDSLVILDDGIVAKEKEIYFAVEKLTPLMQRLESRNPNQQDVITFVLLMRGP